MAGCDFSELEMGCDISELEMECDFSELEMGCDWLEQTNLLEIGQKISVTKKNFASAENL